LMSAGKIGKSLLGGGAVVVALLILTGIDRSLETAAVNASPSWLTSFTSRF
jgi:cytochrome c-type biogenesis protein